MNPKNGTLLKNMKEYPKCHSMDTICSFKSNSFPSMPSREEKTIDGMGRKFTSTVSLLTLHAVKERTHASYKEEREDDAEDHYTRF
jgi:hypothetical protein